MYLKLTVGWVLGHVSSIFFSFFALAQVSFPNSAHAWTLQYLELNSRGEIKEISLK